MWVLNDTLMTLAEDKNQSITKDFQHEKKDGTELFSLPVVLLDKWVEVIEFKRKKMQVLQ